jgi:hypothetical protein
VEFSLATPVWGIPDPEESAREDFRDSICPAITGRLVFDNRDSDTDMRGFFAVGQLPGFRQLDELTGGQLAGVVTLGHYGFAVSGDQDVTAFSDMFMDFPFRRPKPNRNFLTGIAGLIFDVPAGQVRTVPIAFGWFRPGAVTLGRRCEYAYTRHFADLADVLAYALGREEAWRDQANRDDQWLEATGLNDARRFLFAKSVRSYWGNTQLFLEGDRPRWVVNEGSCNMMNTLDLTVDMAFFEARTHPWLLRNVLDASADEYSYTDTLHTPDGQAGLNGGVSFTHDHGARNVFSREGYSHYEAASHPDCFSYMTCEELLNWVLCAGIYYRATEDVTWLGRRASLLDDCLTSLRNRDNPDAGKRDGIMGLDSDRCGDQSEITTYDSLDPSLGQARNNAYMGLKCWAGYLVLEWLLDQAHPTTSGRAAEARQGAQLAANTLTAAFREDLGYIPAILEGRDESPIIPLIEALVYPHQVGLTDAVDPKGPFGELIDVLSKHLRAVLVEGRCLFADGGWKLSGNNDNSWMSKIFVNQFVSERILGFAPDARADEAHDHWWRVGCAGQSVVDQVVAGQSPGAGSTYPRTVSCILWVD